MHMLVNRTFLHKNGSRRYKYLVVNADRTFFINEETFAGKMYDLPNDRLSDRQYFH